MGAGRPETWVPDLPGWVAAADTREECGQLIREAIVPYLKGMREDGEPVPEPSSADAACARPCGLAEQW